MLVVSSLAAYGVVGSEYVEHLDSVVYLDPTLSFGSAASGGSSGSVVHFDGSAPESSVIEFSAPGFRAYSPAWPTESGVDAIVPFKRDGRAFTGGDVRARLLLQRGPAWSGSGSVPFSITAPGAVAAKPGTMALFTLEVAVALLAQGEGWASAAAAAAPAATQDATGSARLRTEAARISVDLEAALGSSGTFTVAGVAGDASELAFLDQMMVAYLRALGPASPSPCGAEKDLEVERVATASLLSVDEVKRAASRFATALVGCDETLYDVARRTASWVQIMPRVLIEDLAHAPKMAGLLGTMIMSIGGASTDATYLWKATLTGMGLREVLLRKQALIELGDGQDVYATYDIQLGGGATRRIRARLSDEQRVAAENNLYLSRIIEAKRFERAALENAILSDDGPEFAQDPAMRTAIGQALPVFSEFPPPRLVPSAVAPDPTAAPASVIPAATPTPTEIPAIASVAPTVQPTPVPTVALAAPTVRPTIAATLTPARDLTGTWRGGINLVGEWCQYSGPLEITLQQTGSVLVGSGETAYTSKATAVRAGDTCAPSAEITRLRDITGTVSSSQVTISVGSFALDLTGSVTTDLMTGTVTSGSSRGCFQLSRAGSGALPDCSNPFLQARPAPAATPVPTVAAAPTPATAPLIAELIVTSTECTKKRETGNGWDLTAGGTVSAEVGGGMFAGQSGANPTCANWTRCYRGATDPATTTWTVYIKYTRPGDSWRIYFSSTLARGTKEFTLVCR